MKTFLIMFTSFLGLMTIIAIAGLVFVNQPRFGYAPTGARAEKIQHSPHFKGDHFKNTIPVTIMSSDDDSKIATMLNFLFGQRDSNLIPKNGLPSVKKDFKNISRKQDFFYLVRSFFILYAN